MLADTDRTTLRETARDAIAYGLQSGHVPDINADQYPITLQQQKASFVTLYLSNRLRGCIGSLQAYRPLIVDVAHNAYAAAFHDPRFPRLSPAEFDDLSLHVSVLDTPIPIQFQDEQDLLSQLEPGVDGLVLEDDGRRGTFLPQVWASLPQPAQFLRELKVKAGLPPNYWSPSIRVERYHVEEF